MINKGFYLIALFFIIALSVIYQKAVFTNAYIDAYATSAGFSNYHSRGGQVLGASTAGLVGYWKLDEGSGTTASDSSGNGNNGTINSGSWTIGKIGQAMSFDGTASNIKTNNLNLSNGSYTFAFWVNRANNGYLVDTGTRRLVVDFGLNGPKNNTLTFYDGTWKSINSVPANEWHHVALVLNGSGNTATMYLDGASSGTSSYTARDVNILTIGSSYTNSAFFKGLLDELRVYNRTLSNSEILDIYNNSEIPVSFPPLSAPPAPIPAPTTPPGISSVNASNITSSTATISWVTNENSDAQVEYGLTASYGLNSFLNSSLTTNHSVNLSSLAASTPYHYRVKSKNSEGVLAVSADYTFTTSANSTGNGPVISNHYPYGVLPPNNRYWLYFETDENANCRYSKTPGVPYSSMANSGFTLTSKKIQRTNYLTDVYPGANNYYIKCVYVSDNTNFNTQDYLISFTISPATMTNDQSVGFFENPTTQGETNFILQPIESVASNVTQRVVFGVPFPKGYLLNSNLNTVRILNSDNQEMSVHIKSLLPWRNLASMTDDSSLRSVAVQMDVVFSDADKDGKADSRQFKVEWGKSNRSASSLAPVSPKSTWVLVNDAQFPASAGVYEPKAYAVFLPSWYSKSLIKTRFNPLGTNPEFSFYDNVYPLFGDSVINNVDPRVASGNLNQYLNIGGTTFETWEYDRPMAIYQLALRSGYFRFLREGHRNSQFYAGTIDSEGYTTIKPPTSEGKDIKYSYLEGLFTDYMLTGDESLNSVMQRIVTAWQGSTFTNIYMPRMNFWTERHLAFRLATYVAGYEALGDPSIGLNAKDTASAAIYMQNNPVPHAPNTGALMHTGGSHGGDGGEEYVASPWMSTLLLDSMERYYIHSGDARVPEFTKKMANYFMSDKAIYVDCGYRIPAPLSECNTYPYYLATDKVLNLNGTQKLPRPYFEDDREHTLDVSKIFALAYFFSRTQGSANQDYLRVFSDLYRTTINYTWPYWIRSEAPASGYTAYRVSPGRKFGWWFKTTSNNDWLLGSGAVLSPTSNLNSAKLDLHLSADKTVASPGDEVTYTLTYRNVGTEDAKSVRIQVPIVGFNSTADVKLVSGSITGGGTGTSEIFWEKPLVRVFDAPVTVSFKLKILNNSTKARQGRWLVPYVMGVKAYYCTNSDNSSNCIPGTSIFDAGRYTKLITGNVTTVNRPYMVSGAFVENSSPSPAPTPTSPAPTIPPISNLTGSNISTSTATISWNTNVATNGQVFYGTTASYGSQSALVDNTTKTTSHTVNLKGLNPATLYHFKVTSIDASSKSISSNDFSFTTLSLSSSTSTSPSNTGTEGSSGSGLTGRTSSGSVTSAGTTVFIPPVNPQANAQSSGMRLINSSGTFYLIKNNQRLGITNPGMLASYGFTFSMAKSATTEDLALALGPLLTPSDGSLVKSKEDPTVYLISNQKRYGFTSAQVFLGLGYKFSSVLVVTDPELQQLPKAENLSQKQAAHLSGTDINKNGTIYWIGFDNQLHAYPSLEIYNSWNIPNDFSKVVPVNQADLSLPIGEMVIKRVVN